VWEVRNGTGVHTHIEVGTVSGRACYRGIAANTPIGEKNWIGKIVPGTTATC
jgi:hypothetical protein